MFTGIIKETGAVAKLRQDSAGARLSIRRRTRGQLKRGESIAVDGVCLTVTAFRNGIFEADLSPETLKKTSLRQLQKGARVNLERPLRLVDSLGGHLVQGHVDALGQLLTADRDGDFAVYRWTYPKAFRQLVVDKGSIAVNGVSLTIVDPEEDSFAAALIPETLAKTNLGELRPGDPVNLEFDVIAKLVRRLAEPYVKAR